MKTLFILLASGVLFIRTYSQPVFPPAWGHYRLLSEKDKSARSDKKDWDKREFDLSPSETRVKNIDRTFVTPESTNVPYPTVIGNGAKRSPYYLAPNTPFSIQDPPANSSEQTRSELNYLLQLQAQRSDEDIRASLYYAKVFYRTSTRPGDQDYNRMQRNLFHIGRSIAPWFCADSLPLTAQLTRNVWQDASYVIWKYKNYFVRIRPYKLEPRLKNLEETNWAAYPSGHASNSYTNAYLFSELLPEFASFFIKDAYDMAHSREIIGVHYPSDSESGRLLGYELIQTLKNNPNFQSDLEKAAKEIAEVMGRNGYQ
jgi:acid phosphatase (class A)